MAGIKVMSGTTANTPVAEYRVETEADVLNLPTTTEQGKAEWCNSGPLPPIGSVCFVIEGFKVYFLSSDGWVSEDGVVNVETWQGGSY